MLQRAPRSWRRRYGRLAGFLWAEWLDERQYWEGWTAKHTYPQQFSVALFSRARVSQRTALRHALRVALLIRALTPPEVAARIAYLHFLNGPP
jgi:hypothetical protein